MKCHDDKLLCFLINFCMCMQCPCVVIEVFTCVSVHTYMQVHAHIYVFCMWRQKLNVETWESNPRQKLGIAKNV